MIIDPDVFLGSILPDLSKWFNKSDVEYKRVVEAAMTVDAIINCDL